MVMVLASTAVNVLAVIAMHRSKSDGPLGLAVGITAMFAFVGMLALSQKTDGTWRITEAGMRTAIASTLVAVYISLVSMLTFHVADPGTINPITQALLSSFTSIVGVAMAFYFGASAYVEGRRITTNRREIAT